METGTKDSPGLESVREQIKSATVGKTIESIELVDNPSTDPLVHSDERLTLRFTDGTDFCMEIGSNCWDLVAGVPGLDPRRLRLNFQPVAARD
jgi:hypothetical protein